MFKIRNNLFLKRLRPAFCAGVSVLLFFCLASEATAGTIIKRVRYAVWPGCTRLIFDAEGERPKKLSPGPENDSLLISFASLGALPRTRTVDSRGLIGELTYRKTGKEANKKTGQSAEAVIAYRMPGLRVSHRFIKTEEDGRYKLIVAFRAPKNPPPAPEPAPARAQQATTEVPSQPKPIQFVEASEQDLKLFEKADALFLQNQDHLAQAALEIILFGGAEGRAKVPAGAARQLPDGAGPACGRKPNEG